MIFEVSDVEDFIPYHKGLPSRPSQVPLEKRSFIAWDGEGMNLRGVGKPQSLVLFGASTGDRMKGPGLHTFALLDFIIEVGRKNPQGIHVGYAFSYDMNMLVQSLHPQALLKIHKHGYVNLLSRSTGYKYCIIMRRGKWFSITRYEPNYSRKTNRMAKHTVRIYDIFGFFTSKFVDAAEKMLGADAPGLDIVREGKERRKEFTYDELPYVERYWEVEVPMVAQVAEELRSRMYSVGLKISQWHGPGALASYAFRNRGIKRHMEKNNDDIRRAARYGYAGGRFELFKVGRFAQRCYGVDINSAYPFAISQLPSLTEGFWQFVENPTRIARFGIYHVVLSRSVGFDRKPGPLFHRDSKGNISYPWITDGWYWSPEVAGLLGKRGVDVVAGWEYLGAKSRPFEWVTETYEERRARKVAGDPTEMSLKLLMNSLYGKMAQRVGYDPETGRLPPWHQLEWAGWVTSYTRSMLYRIMSKIPWDSLIAVETDGIYTTTDPTKLGITNSKELGGWEVTEFDEIMYVQSGLAWLRQGDEWKDKRRGLDAETFKLEQCQQFLQGLKARSKWEPYKGMTTRFVGLGAALASGEGVKAKHCVWQTTPREVSPGAHGKRVHAGDPFCPACSEGATAYDMPHDLVIRSLSRTGEMSYPHSIPWEPDAAPSAEEWRAVDDLEAEYIR